MDCDVSLHKMSLQKILKRILMRCAINCLISYSERASLLAYLRGKNGEGIGSKIISFVTMYFKFLSPPCQVLTDRKSFW